MTEQMKKCMLWSSYIVFVAIIQIISNFVQARDVLNVQEIDAKYVIESVPLATDPRIHVMHYKKDSIFKYVGFYEYQSSIIFDEGEKFVTISMGNQTGWQMVPAGNRLFLKPINNQAETNMTIITNKRVYRFELYADFAGSIRDKRLVFETRFKYPLRDSIRYIEQTVDDEEVNVSIVPVINSTNVGKYNLNYTYSGDEKIAPVKIFDDGIFTYMEFSPYTTELPAIFLVDTDGFEGIVNYKVSKNYIIIERVESVFTLRNGNNIVCVFNENQKHSVTEEQQKNPAKFEE